MSGASITGTRANTFVKNDQLRNGGHGVVTVYPSAIVIEGGLSDSNDGAGCFSVWGNPIVHKKVGRRGYPFLAIVRSLIIILVDCGFRENGSGTARLTDIQFSGNRLHSLCGSQTTVVGRELSSEGVVEGSISLSCNASDDCTNSLTPLDESVTLSHDIQVAYAHGQSSGGFFGR